MYGVNRTKYYKLLGEFQKNNTFPAPYSFHCLTGFFGAMPIAYFFLNLNKKKKIFFLKRDSNSYIFFDKRNSELIKWMPAFYYSSITSTICCALIVAIAASLEMKDKFFP
ncbi:membrane protein [Erwinia typographi]|uniref:Membrane protein n=1 Tax=Erwinia typographi TaxID=371042 RepID=A0A0A3ZDU7_9GAMM|nr:membrane protein [Erwinia typographi]